MVKPVSLSALRGDSRNGQAVQHRNWRHWAQQVCLVIVTGTAPLVDRKVDKCTFAHKWFFIAHVGASVCGGQRWVSGVFFLHLSALFFESLNLELTSAGWLASESLGVSCATSVLRWDTTVSDMGASRLNLGPRACHRSPLPQPSSSPTEADLGLFLFFNLNG